MSECDNNGINDLPVKSYNAESDFLASRHEQLEFFRVIEKGVPQDIVRNIRNQKLDVNFEDYDSRTYLHLAADLGNPGVLSVLLQEGARSNVYDRWAQTPLDCAIKSGSTEAVAVLEANGAKRGPIIENIMHGSSSGDSELVQLILLKFPNEAVNYKDHDKRTPLHLACSEGQFEISDLLMYNGADPLLQDRYGSTPIDMARIHYHKDIVRLLENYTRNFV